MSQHHVVLPNLKTTISGQAEQARVVKMYGGIYANQLAQFIVTDVIKNLSSCDKCDDMQLSSLIADTIAIEAAKRSV